MNKERTGTIKCNQHWYENEWPLLKDIVGIESVDVEIKTHPTVVYLIRCKSDKFDIAHNYPEYVFALSKKDGKLAVKSMENTGRIL